MGKRLGLVGSLFAARRSAPDREPGRASSIWLPAKRGGVVVTHESALQLSACFACIRVISADIAKLPWHVFAEQNGARVKLGRSPIGYLLSTRPNPTTGAFAWRETMIAWALAWGNAYAEIERDATGRPVALWQIAPDRVAKRWDTDGGIYYEISNAHKDPTRIESRDMFDLHGFGFDGLEGYSTIALAAQSIGFGIAAEQHGSAFYGNNAVLGMVLEHPGKVSELAYTRLKESLDERKGGGAFKPFIAEEGMKVSVPATKQVDAQYVETRKMQVEEICRWFRVPLQKVMNQDHAHYSSVEQMNISYVTDTLGEWIKRLEEEADYKLISARSQASYTKINTRAIMRGDSAAQAQWYREMRNIGVYSVNEIRELEDMDPVPGGEKRVLQVNMTTLEKIGEEPEAAQAVEPAVLAVASRLIARVAKCGGDVDDHLARDRASTVRTLRDITPSLCLAYGTEVDAERLADFFEYAAREYVASDGRMSIEEVRDTIMGAFA